ncbi:MAG TPA: peptidoglycan DD-metalloendopeptidase family protein [Actinomycetota bacterium]|nr:peptidoglycan DD-metalloendopeptidase family protein [Actinomycetota bacterium]
MLYSKRRSFACAVALVSILSLLAGPANAAPFPPQLPSAEEMARLQAQMNVALTKVRAAQATLDQVVREYETAQDQLTDLVGKIGVAQARQDALEAELRAAQASINTRAASTYRSERIGMVNVVLQARSFREFLTAFGLMRAVTIEDSKTLLRVRELRAETAAARTDLEGQRAAQQRMIGDLAKKQDQVEGSLRATGKEYEAVRAEVEKRKSGFAFPVKAPYSYSNSYGAPRMEGTKYYHSHEGTDIFALSGTPILAVVDGVLENVGTAPLGGIKLWLRSPGDNWSYYYAHLSSYATGVASGVRVKKGQVIGYVGNTGNARGTPPHVHFETHVPSGAPTNPHPILRRVDPLAR